MSERNPHGYASIDELIKEALQQRAGKDTDINLEEAWEKFNQKYHTKKQKPVLKLALAACLICLILGAPLFLFPVEGGAFGSKLFKSIKTFLNGKVQSVEISFNSSPWKEKESTENYLNPKIIRALQDVPYKILLPVDMLGMYEIKQIETDQLGNSTEVNITMVGEKSEQIIITEINIIKGFEQGISYDTEDAQMKNVKVKGQDAILINYKNNLVDLSWMDMDIFISISGEASEDDILLLANAMRRIDYSTK
ncbi:DUF4367 domain-containing protein [Desulfoscipio sp. XC116]|uniref:DUF4367 domain-containing protein n=1 Tax=Desulfoscipio sp. XC116 TaxID=3144975 RepID=UPI00325BAE4A